VGIRAGPDILKNRKISGPFDNVKPILSRPQASKKVRFWGFCNGITIIPQFVVTGCLAESLKWGDTHTHTHTHACSLSISHAPTCAKHTHFTVRKVG